MSQFKLEIALNAQLINFLNLAKPDELIEQIKAKGMKVS